MRFKGTFPSFAARLLLAVAGVGLFALQGGAAAAHPRLADSRDVVLKKGDCLDGLLARNGIGPNRRAAVMRALVQDGFRPRALRAGSHLVLTFAQGQGEKEILTLKIPVNGHKTVLLASRADGSFAAVKDAQAAAAQVPQMTLHAVTGHVGRNFQSTLHAAGVPAKVAEEAHKALVYAADLPVRPAAGAWFHVVFETAPHAGAARAPAALRSVTLDFKGRRRSVYRYPVGQDMTAFVEPNGLGMLLAHLADPVPRAHVTSAWGWRIHPILDRPEFHEGIDMAAPMGTPIRAPASGTVVFAGEHGNYGILLKIRHISRLVTAYGHLERIAGGLHDGTYVKKGQVVGYVGSSGLSTGPHLYYEVWVDGRRVNPAQKDIAVPVHLGGARFRKFLSVG